MVVYESEILLNLKQVFSYLSAPLIEIWYVTKEQTLEQLHNDKMALKKADTQFHISDMAFCTQIPIRIAMQILKTFCLF